MTSTFAANYLKFKQFTNIVISDSFLKKTFEAFCLLRLAGPRSAVVNYLSN